MGVPEFRNCIAPVGAMPRLVLLTVAVRVTDWPDETVVDGLTVRPTLVGA